MPLRRDRETIEHPAREARSGRRVPHGNPEQAGFAPHVRFRVARLRERRPNARFDTRRPSGPVLAVVIGVRPVGHDNDSPLPRHGAQGAPQLLLAEVASVRGVSRVARVIQLAGRDFDEIEIEPAGDVERPGVLVGGIGRASADCGDRLVAAEDLARGDGEEGGIDAAGVPHQHGGK